MSLASLCSGLGADVISHYGLVHEKGSMLAWAHV